MSMHRAAPGTRGRRRALQVEIEAAAAVDLHGTPRRLRAHLGGPEG